MKKENDLTNALLQRMSEVTHAIGARFLAMDIPRVHAMVKNIYP